MEVIPSFKCDDVIFSDTYAKFAADLMADVSRELLAITTKLDRHLEFNRRGDREYLRAQALSVDKPLLVSARQLLPVDQRAFALRSHAMAPG